MDEKQKNLWFAIGYFSALGVLWLTQFGIPRLIDWLSEEGEVIVIDPKTSDNGTKEGATESVVREAVESE